MNLTIKQSYKQSGAALFTALIFLMILTLAGVTALRNSGLSERMSSNAQLSQMAFNAAESAMDRYIAEYNYNVGANAVSETEVANKVAHLAKYLPVQTSDGWIEYCIDNASTVLSRFTDSNGDMIYQTNATCGTTTLDGGQNAVTAKNKVSYMGCPGSCPRYSLGLGKQKVSCHVLLMEAQGTVNQSTSSIDQWVTLQGPC